MRQSAVAKLLLPPVLTFCLAAVLLILPPAKGSAESVVRKITVVGQGESLLDVDIAGLKISGYAQADLPFDMQELGNLSTMEMRAAAVENEDATAFTRTYSLLIPSSRREEAEAALKTFRAQVRQNAPQATVEFLYAEEDADDEEARLAAMKKALYDAKEKAQYLAKTYNMVVNEPIEILEEGAEIKHGKVVVRMKVTFEMS